MKTRRFALSAALGIVAVLSVGTAAWAHTALVAVTPGDGDVVETAEVIELEFNETLLGLGVVVTVTDPNGLDVVVGEPDLSVPRHVIQAIDAQAPGAYDVIWRVVAEDGHPVEGAFSFELAPSESVLSTAEPSESASPAASPSAAATPAATTVETPGTAPAESDATPSTGLLVALAGAVMAALVFALRYAAGLKR